jgi:hypothetical protein
LLAAAAPFLPLIRRYGVRAEAAFDEEILYAAGNMDLRVRPIRIAGPLAAFLLSPATLRAAKTLVWHSP